MPSLVPDPDTGEPIWDYDLAARKKPAKKAASQAAKPAKKDEE